MSATASIAAVGAATRHVFLSPEMDDAVASLPRGYFDLDFVLKHATLGGL
jgi:hypothetical protein